MKQIIFNFSILICLFLAAAASSYAQTNLLLNPNADSGTENWGFYGEASVEEFNGEKVFVVRNKGSFAQTVNLTGTDIGKFALFIGRGSSERINKNDSITGLPYLYGYMVDSNRPCGSKIYAYLQGQKMLGRSLNPDEWVTMFGIFRVPGETGAIRFFLEQAERKYEPQNGSAARFNNVGLYLFETEEAALEFVQTYNLRGNLAGL